MKSLWRYLPQWAKQCPQMLTDILVVTMAFHHYIICYFVQFLNCFIIMMKLIMIPASKTFLVSFLISLLLKWRLLTEQQWSDISYPPQWILWPRPQWSPSTRLEQVPEKPDPKKRYTLYMFATTTEYFLMNCNRSNSGIKHRERRVFKVFFNIFEIGYKDCLSRPHLQIL